MKKLGTLIGNTGNVTVSVAVVNSFSVRRGEFVRVKHYEREDDQELWVLGRIIGAKRENVMFDPRLGEGLAEVELVFRQPAGETNFAMMEIIGYKDPETQEVRMPRRPLDPGSPVYAVDKEFLSEFYEYIPETSIHLGNLVGYERGSNIVPVYLDIDKIVTEHLAVLAMTGSGKSYTVGRIIERMLAQANASILVFDSHGEYGAAFRGGELRFNRDEVIDMASDAEDLRTLRQSIRQLQEAGGGIHVYTPNDTRFYQKYANKCNGLALQLDQMDIDDMLEIFPDMSEAQQRVLGLALRYWIETTSSPRDTNALVSLLTERLDELTHWKQLYDSERKVLNERSASIVSLRLKRLITEAKSFYEPGRKPFNVKDVVGCLRTTNPRDHFGRIAIVDLQGVAKSSAQVIVALIMNEVLKASVDKEDPIAPVFIVIEEGHNFAPAKEAAISKNVIKKTAAEGRKFGVGIGIISQRPSKLDPDVTSQCNTIITMRIKNPDDQRFIRSSSDFFSEMDIQELPALSTGEALVSGRAILAPLVVKVGTKVLVHGGESPKVTATWKSRRVD